MKVNDTLTAMRNAGLAQEHLERVGALAEAVKALDAAHYELVCLEPRLSGQYQRSVGLVKDACSKALAKAKL
jgi:hypothetical protein